MTRGFRVHASNYAWAEAATTLAGIASFPILTRLLSVADYGTMNLVTSMLGLAVACGKLGLQHAALRMWAGVATGRAGHSMAAFEATVLGGMLASGTAALLVWLATVSFVPAGWWGEPGAGIVAWLAAPLILIRVLDSAATNDLRAREASGALAIYSVARRYVLLLAIVGTLWWWSRDLVGFYLASIVFEALALAVLLGWMFRGRPWPAPRDVSWPLYRSLAVFGLPMLGSELANVVLALGDRLVIQAALGAEDLGIYAASYNMCDYLRNALLGAMAAAAYPRCVRLWESEGRAGLQRFLQTFLIHYTIAATFMVALMAVAGGELMALLASSKFAAGGTVTGWIMAGMAIQSVLAVAAIGLLLHKRTLLLMLLVIAAGATSVGLNALLVPRLGIRGAGIAVFAVFALLAAAQLVLARRDAPVVVPWRALAIYGCTALVASLGAARIELGATGLDLVARSATLLAAHALALVLFDRPLVLRLLQLRPPRGGA